MLTNFSHLGYQGPNLAEAADHGEETMIMVSSPWSAASARLPGAHVILMFK